jgi:putative FmdB family regulatory protein
MPTYEYACEKCGERFEVVQSMTEDPLTTHDGCGGTVARVFGAVGISFKGSGFYRTDSGSRKSAGGNTKRSDNSSGSSGGSSDSGGSSSTPSSSD